MTRYLLLALLAFAGGAAATADVALDLNAAEREWLAANRSVSICVAPDWLPFEMLNARGEHEGIAADLLRLVAQRSGLQLDIVPTSDWGQSVAFSQAGRCQLLSFLNQTPVRDAWLIFTQPLFTDANVVIAREDHPYVADLSALENATVALPSGTFIEESVRRDFPQLHVISTETDAQALALVNERKADLTVRSLTVAAYTIRREGWFNLKIAGQVASLDNQFRIGVLKSEPVLRDILNKAIATITPVELHQIANRQPPCAHPRRVRHRLPVAHAGGGGFLGDAADESVLDQALAPAQRSAAHQVADRLAYRAGQPRGAGSALRHGAGAGAALSPTVVDRHAGYRSLQAHQ